MAGGLTPAVETNSNRWCLLGPDKTENSLWEIGGKQNIVGIGERVREPGPLMDALVNDCCDASPTTDMCHLCRVGCVVSSISPFLLVLSAPLHPRGEDGRGDKDDHLVT